MPGPDVDQPEDFGVRLRWPTDDPSAVTDRPLRARRDTPPSVVEDDEPGASLAVRPAAGPDDGDDGPGGDNLPAVLPAMVGRLETVHGAVATLSMRIDALVAATNNVRSSLTDRVTEYAETMAQLVRSQASDVEDYRHGTERVTGELRRSLAEGDDALRRLSSRVEEIAGDVTMLGDLLRAHQGDNREVLEGGEQLARTVTEGLDSFGQRVLDGLENATAATGDVAAVVRAEMSTLRRDLQELRRSRFDVNLLAEIRSEVASLTDTVQAGDAPLEALMAASEAIKGAGTELRADLEAAAAAALQEQLDGIEGLRANVEQLQADEARTHRIVPEVVRALTEEMAQLREQLTADDAPAQASASPPPLDRAAVRREMQLVVDAAVTALRGDIAAAAWPGAAEGEPSPVGADAGAATQLVPIVRAAVADAMAEHAPALGAVSNGDSERVDVDPAVVRDEVRAVLAEELEPVREELKALRRRLGVRAKPPVLTDEQLSQLAAAVAEATAGSTTATTATTAEARLSDPQIETLAEIVVDRLERSLELVEDEDEVDTSTGAAGEGAAEGAG
jgi:hypothetical protein